MEHELEAALGLNARVIFFIIVAAIIWVVLGDYAINVTSPWMIGQSSSGHAIARWAMLLVTIVAFTPALLGRRTLPWLFIAVPVGCVLLLLMGFYVEYTDGILPCPLCVLQRFAYGLVGLAALVGVISQSARCVSAWSAAVFSLLGAGFAWRQVYLQVQPANPNASCVPGLSYLFHMFPFPKAVQLALTGTADCAKVHWALWGLSMARLSLIAFGCLLLLTLSMALFSRNAT